MNFKDRFLRLNAPFLTRFLRFLADQIEQLIPGTPIVATPVIFTSEGITKMSEITVSSDLAELSASVTYLDSKGSPTVPADVPVWSSSDETVATVTAADDGMSATIVPLNPGGAGGSAAVISVVAHDDDGEEVRSEGTVTVQPGDAVIGEVTFDAPHVEAQ
jgi:hypothetical protein